MKKYKKVILAVITAVFLAGCGNTTQNVTVEVNGRGNTPDIATTTESLTTISSKTKQSSTTTEIIETTIDMTEQILSEAELSAEAGNYIAAIDCIRRAQKTYGDNDAYSETLEYYCVSYKVTSVNTADDLASNGDYLQAIKVIDKTIETIGSDDELTAKTAEYKNSYALSVISSADKAVAVSDYDNAVEIVEDALKQLPNNALLTDKLNEINSKKPIDVMDTEIIYDGTHMEKITPGSDTVFSMGSETFNKGFTMTVSSYYFEETFALFDLKEKYSYITFNAGRTNNSEIADVTLQVYLDGELSQEYSINAKMPINSFEIPLNSASYMQLKLKLNSSCYSYIPYGFADVMLYPAE